MQHKRPIPTGLKITITIAAGIFGLGYLFLPLLEVDLNIDAVTLAFLIAAFLPWLYPYIDTVELGGTKIGFSALEKASDEILEHAPSRSRLDEAQSFGADHMMTSPDSASEFPLFPFLEFLDTDPLAAVISFRTEVETRIRKYRNQSQATGFLAPLEELAKRLKSEESLPPSVGKGMRTIGEELSKTVQDGNVDPETISWLRAVGPRLLVSMDKILENAAQE